MEIISTSAIILSFSMGLLLGFFTMFTEDIRIKIIVDCIGAISLILAIWVLMPSIEWGTPLNERVEILSNFIQTALSTIIIYTLGDAFGSAGYMLSSGISGHR
ncbi:MAG: hypothetical protein JXQ82_04480 [Methanomicrobiaceae archaeon]|nr:hypothetical protein [Methanomicrobiaceae archaeon]